MNYFAFEKNIFWEIKVCTKTCFVYGGGQENFKFNYLRSNNKELFFFGDINSINSFEELLKKAFFVLLAS